jgi:hypothetical protein
MDDLIERATYVPYVFTPMLFPRDQKISISRQWLSVWVLFMYIVGGTSKTWLEFLGVNPFSFFFLHGSSAVV